MQSAFDDCVSRLNEKGVLRSLASAISNSYVNDLPKVLGDLAIFNPQSIHLLEYGPLPIDYVVAVWFKGSAWYFWRGLGSIGDFVDAYLKSNQVPTVSVEGSCNRLAATNVANAKDKILADIAANAAFFGTIKTDVLFAGHSQGGANSLAFFSQTTDAERGKIDRSQIVTFQSPRTLSPLAAQNLNVNHLRIQMSGDLVSHLPPNFWTENYPPYSLPPKSPILYQHHGTAIQLFPDGETEILISDSPGLDQGYYQISRGILLAALQVPAHVIAGAVAALDSGGPFINGLDPSIFDVPTANFFTGGSSMPYYKLSYEFEQGKWGWSENFYIQRDNLSLATTAATATPLLNARAALLGNNPATGTANPSLTAVRISNYGLQRDSTLVYLNQPGTFAVGGMPDIPNTCILVSIKSKYPGDPTARYRRSLYMRGIPDDMVTLGGKFVPTGLYSANFSAWCTQLFNMTAGTIAKRVDANAIMNTLIENVGADVVVTTGAAHGLESGDIAQIYGVKPSGVFGGEFQVIKVDNNKYKILAKQLVGTPTWYGSTSKAGLVFAPFDELRMLRAGHRDTGRPFDSPRGRQRTK